VGTLHGWHDTFSLVDSDQLIRVMYGYRPIEFGVHLLGNNAPDASFRVTKLRAGFYSNWPRTAVRISLGCDVAGAALPVPDFDHQPSVLAAVTKRVAAAMPPINRQRLRGFRHFVKRFCNRYLRSLKFNPDETFDFEPWIENAPYSQARKNELRSVHLRNLEVHFEALGYKQYRPRVKGFVKDEYYCPESEADMKHFRGIHSRDDGFKCRTGPFFKLFGDKLFALKWFIKKIPIDDRPRALLEKLGKYSKIFCTDFSQFESTFVRELMKIEVMVYKWCLEGHPRLYEMDSLFNHLLRDNIVDYKHFSFKVQSKRMSGEMNTSCGNGLMNLLMTMYILTLNGNDIDKCDAFFEGDDGIIGCFHLPNQQNYTDLGARIKIEVPSSIAEASFCGNIFHPAVLDNVTNPSEASVSFGWSYARRYRHANKLTLEKLLLAKSLSYLYQYPGCPIIRNLALYGIRCTKHHIKSIDKKFMINAVGNGNAYYYEEVIEKALDQYEDLLKRQIHPYTRELVERKFGISICAQVRAEQYLDSLGSIQQLDLLPFLNVPDVWRKVSDIYVKTVARDRKDPAFHFNVGRTPYFTSPQVMCFAH